MPKQQTAGNGVATAKTFAPLTGDLTAIQSGTGGAVQNFGYSYDVLGRLTTRSDANTALSESFTYDALSRLATAQVGVDIAKSFSYNAIGNILIKSDVGNYTYPAPGQPFPYAVSSISGSVVNTTFTYDANGNQNRRQRPDADLCLVQQAGDDRSRLGADRLCA